MIRTNPIKLIRSWIEPNWSIYLSTQQPKLWFFSILIGFLVSLAAILFRLGNRGCTVVLAGLRRGKYHLGHSSRPTLACGRRPHAWRRLCWCILAVYPSHQARRRRGRCHRGAGPEAEEACVSGKHWIARLVTIVSLGAGASAGREGPIVHLGASLARSLGRKLTIPAAAQRVLLACGVASAVSASFNAPIAGVLFAHEVILGHYAVSAFVPIALASAVGTTFSRLFFGGRRILHYPRLPDHHLLGAALLCPLGYRLRHHRGLVPNLAARNRLDCTPHQNASYLSPNHRRFSCRAHCSGLPGGARRWL